MHWWSGSVVVFVDLIPSLHTYRCTKKHHACTLHSAHTHHACTLHTHTMHAHTPNLVLRQAREKCGLNICPSSKLTGITRRNTTSATQQVNIFLSSSTEIAHKSILFTFSSQADYSNTTPLFAFDWLYSTVCFQMYFWITQEYSLHLFSPNWAVALWSWCLHLFDFSQLCVFKCIFGIQ